MIILIFEPKILHCPKRCKDIDQQYVSQQWGITAKTQESRTLQVDSNISNSKLSRQK